MSGGTPSDIWKLLYSLEQSVRRWPATKATVVHHLDRLITVLNVGQTPILGLSVHQAKGLQWPHVDVLDPSRAYINYKLEQQSDQDRLLYVALTRAEQSVRLRPMHFGYRWNYSAPGIVI